MSTISVNLAMEMLGTNPREMFALCEQGYLKPIKDSVRIDDDICFALFEDFEDAEYSLETVKALKEKAESILIKVRQYLEDEPKRIDDFVKGLTDDELEAISKIPKPADPISFSSANALVDHLKVKHSTLKKKEREALIAKAVDEQFPGISDTKLAKLISGPNASQNWNTLNSQGRRARGKKK